MVSGILRSSTTFRTREAANSWAEEFLTRTFGDAYVSCRNYSTFTTHGQMGTQGSEYHASALRSIMNLALLQNWSPFAVMEAVKRHLGLSSAHDLNTFENELFQVTPHDREPLSAFLLRMSVALAQHCMVAEQQWCPSPVPVPGLMGSLTPCVSPGVCLRPRLAPPARSAAVRRRR